MVAIFRNLSWPDLNAVSLVCKFWYDLSKDKWLRSAIGSTFNLSLFTATSTLIYFYQARREGRLRNVGRFGVLKPDSRLMQPKIRQIVVWKDLLAVVYCQSTIKVVWNHMTNVKKKEDSHMEVDKPQENEKGKEDEDKEDNTLAVIASASVPPIDGEGNMDYLTVWTPIHELEGM